MRDQFEYLLKYLIFKNNNVNILKKLKKYLLVMDSKGRLLILLCIWKLFKVGVQLKLNKKCLILNTRFSNIKNNVSIKYILTKNLNWI